MAAPPSLGSTDMLEAVEQPVQPELFNSALMTSQLAPPAATSASTPPPASNIRDLARLSRIASRNSYATVDERNTALESVKSSLLQNKDVILAANRVDLEREQKKRNMLESTDEEVGSGRR